MATWSQSFFIHHFQTNTENECLNVIQNKNEYKNTNRPYTKYDLNSHKNTKGIPMSFEREQIFQLRDRNEAHTWVVKSVSRAFRHNLNNIDGKNCDLVYYKLSEIDSDFCERKHTNTQKINSLVRTCAAYCRMGVRLVNLTMMKLQKWGLIDYGVVRNPTTGKAIGSFLKMYTFTELQNICMKKDISLEEYLKDPEYNKNHMLYLPHMVNLTQYKNNNKLLTIVQGSEPLDDVVIDTDIGKESKTLTKVQIRTEQYLPFAKRLARIIQQIKEIKVTPSKLLAWADDIRKLNEVEGIDKTRMKDALQWYKDHIGEQYVPEIQSGYAFRKKFQSLENAVKRTSFVSPSSDFEIPEEMSGHCAMIVEWVRTFKKISTTELQWGKFVTGVKSKGKMLSDAYDIWKDEEEGMIVQYIPNLKGLLASYIEWIDNQSWVEPDLNLFQENNGVFLKFLDDYERNDIRISLTSNRRYM